MSLALPTRDDLLGAAIVGVIFLALLFAAELWRRIGNGNPEWTRKLVHLGGGLACLSFPWLVRSPVLVVAMGALLSALFAAGARTGFLPSLHSVARSSRGAEYYPLAIALLFLLAHDRPWLYVSCVLVLAVSDALAALIGSQYGQVRYEVEDEEKSLEGSIAFLVATFLAVHLPLLLMSDLPRPNVVLIALLIAVLMTGLEIICLRGTDNLFVPLAVYLALDRMTTKPLGEVVYQNVSLIAIALVTALAVTRIKTLNVGGAVAFMLFTYAGWSLGSAEWAVPVFSGFAGWLAVVRLQPLRRPRPLTVRVRLMFRTVLVPLLILLCANATSLYGVLFGPYLAALSAVVALSLWWQILHATPPLGARRPIAAFGVAVASALLVAVPPWLLQPWTGAGAVVAIVAVTVAALFASDLPVLRYAAIREHDPWSTPRFVVTLGAGAVILLLQHLELIGPWPLGG